MLSRLFPLLLIVSALGGCTDKDKNKKEKTSEITKEEVDDASKTLEDKRSAGDTLVLPAEDLLKVIPSYIEGYMQDGKAELRNEKAASNSWSIAKQKYHKGETKLAITVADYNGAFGMYAGATSIFSDVDTQEERSRVVTVKDAVKGWETFKKKTGEASLILAVADRYLVTLEADHQEGTKFLRNIVDKIKIEELPGY